MASCVAWMCCRMSNPIKQLLWACPDLSSRHGNRYILQSCCSWCYVIQPVHHILHEYVVGCPILSSMYQHVPIYHSIVLNSTPSYTLCALTSHHRVCCCSGLICLYSSSWMISVRDKNLARANSEFFIRHASNFALFALELLVIQLHTLCLGLYFFAHSSRYDFSPSRWLQLWFRALCGTSSRFLDSNFSPSHLM